ncbi:hypothetical protein LI82_04085 [Methanococcoides methylutens]|uniref:Uncharacterized protein n=1 Tax=Methanococcoides methylutens TaxID=2226 RepID=A0A099T280_METMT|nr:hypothetical protein [Methanococcoides methylutens]KGK99212.1 hypothetical protein LI82_04085 [Methanococcoides methylutens]
MVQNEIIEDFALAMKDHIVDNCELVEPVVTKTGKKQSEQTIKRRFDCSLKYAILNTVLENNGLKLPELYKRSKWDNYPSFKKGLSNLCTKGYIDKSGTRMNYRYYITETGKFHAEKPTFELDTYFAKLKSRVDKITFDSLKRIVQDMDDDAMVRFAQSVVGGIDIESYLGEAMRDEYNNIKSQNASLQSSNSSLQSTVSSLRNEVGGIKSNVFDLDKHVADGRSITCHEADENELYGKKYDNMDDYVSDIENSLESAYMKISELKDGIISDEEKQDIIDEKKRKLVIVPGSNKKPAGGNKAKSVGKSKIPTDESLNRTLLIKDNLGERCSYLCYKKLKYYFPYTTEKQTIVDRLTLNKGDIAVMAVSSATAVNKHLKALKRLTKSQIDNGYESYILLDGREREYVIRFNVHGNDFETITLQSQKEYADNIEHLIETGRIQPDAWR